MVPTVLGDSKLQRARLHYGASFCRFSNLDTLDHESDAGSPPGTPWR